MTKLQNTRPSSKIRSHLLFRLRNGKKGSDAAGPGAATPQALSPNQIHPPDSGYEGDLTNDGQTKTKSHTKSAWQRLNRWFEAPRDKVAFVNQRPGHHKQTAAKALQDSQNDAGDATETVELGVDNVEPTSAEQPQTILAIPDAEEARKEDNSMEQLTGDTAIAESISQHGSLGKSSKQPQSPEETLVDVDEVVERAVKAALAQNDAQWQDRLQAKERGYKRQLEEQSQSSRESIDFWKLQIDKAKAEAEDAEKRHQKEVDRLKFCLGLRKATIVLLGKRRREELATRDQELDDKEAVIDFLQTQNEQRVRDCQIAGIKLAAVDQHEQALHDEHAKYVESANSRFQEIERRCRELIASYEQEQQKGVQTSQNYMELLRQYERLLQDQQQQSEEQQLMEKQIHSLESVNDDQANQINALKSQLLSLAQSSHRSAATQYPSPETNHSFLPDSEDAGHGHDDSQPTPQAQKPFGHFGQTSSGQPTPFSFSNHAHSDDRFTQHPQDIFNSAKPSTAAASPRQSQGRHGLSSKPKHKSRYANVFSEQDRIR